MITKYENLCIICGKKAENTHHLIFGRGIRPLCDADSLTAPMCHFCHAELHTTSTVASELSRICGQLAYEKHLIAEEGVTEDVARERFRQRYGKSYL